MASGCTATIRTEFPLHVEQKNDDACKESGKINGFEFRKCCENETITTPFHQTSKSSISNEDKTRVLEAFKVAVTEDFPFSEWHHTQSLNGAQFTKQVHFWQSNEYPTYWGNNSNLNFLNTLKWLDEYQPKPTSLLSAALLIGESSLLAALPELCSKFDITLLVDKDQVILRWQQYRIKEIQQDAYCCAADQACFIERQISIANQLGNTEESKLRRKLSYNAQCQGKYNAFYSQKRLEEVKQASRQIQIAALPINIFDDESLEVLAEQMKKYGIEITFVNLSNAMEYKLWFFTNERLRDTEHLTLPYQPLKQLPHNPNTWYAFSGLKFGLYFTDVQPASIARKKIKQYLWIITAGNKPYQEDYDLKQNLELLLREMYESTSGQLKYIEIELRVILATAPSSVIKKLALEGEQILNGLGETVQNAEHMQTSIALVKAACEQAKAQYTKLRDKKTEQEARFF